MHEDREVTSYTSTNGIESVKEDTGATTIGFVAYTGWGPAHVVIFDYLFMKYLLYDYRYPDQVIEDSPMIVYCNDTLHVEENAFDTPLLIVPNPTNGENDWIFTLITPYGVFNYFIQRIETNVTILSDFIVLWEDQYNPFSGDQRLDDWGIM